MAKKKIELSLEEKVENAIIPIDERPYKIPDNWVWTRLGSGFNVTSSKRIHKKDWVTEGIPFYRTRELVKLSRYGYVDNELFISEKMYNECKEISGVPNIGDILLSGVGTIGVPYVISDNKKIYFKDGNVIWLQNNGVFHSNYIYHFFNCLFAINQVTNMSSGSTVDTYTIKNAKITKVPLPPLQEQERIVSRIESLFSKLDEAKEIIEKSLNRFKERKSAILHKAFNGELTKIWREENPYLQNHLQSDMIKFSNKLPTKSKNQILLELDSIKINDIESWYNCTVGAIGIVSNGSTPSRKEKKYWNGNINWVSSGEVKNNLIFKTNEKITEDGYKNSSVNLLPKGTILLAMIGEGKTRGQTSILDIEATINQNIASIIVNDNVIIPKFLWFLFQKNYHENRQIGNGTGPKALNCQRVRELNFVLPPLQEQEEIVRILDNLLDKEQQATELSDQLDKIELMKKAILGKAFRGELGTNNPFEDSAESLLKEILEKEEEEKPKPKKRTKKTPIPPDILATLKTKFEEKVYQFVLDNNNCSLDTIFHNFPKTKHLDVKTTLDDFCSHGIIAKKDGCFAIC